MHLEKIFKMPSHQATTKASRARDSERKRESSSSLKKSLPCHPDKIKLLALNLPQNDSLAEKQKRTTSRSRTDRL